MNAPAFSTPSFDVFLDSGTHWREKAESLFRQHCDAFLEKVVAKIDDAVARGILTRIQQPKDKLSPLALRDERAVRRYCYNEPYKDLATNEHSPDKVRKAVAKIFEETDVRGCSKRK